MSRRIVALFTTVCVLMCALCLRVYSITQSSYAAAQRSGSTVTVEVCKTRGVFYDCNMNLLTNRETEKRAAIVPTAQALAAIYNYFSVDEADLLMKRLSRGKPVVSTVSDDFSAASGATVFDVSKRYGTQPLAPHIIGYLDGGGRRGISGLEKALTIIWRLPKAKSRLPMMLDAGARSFGRKTENRESGAAEAGVKLTLDAEIQQLAQNAAKRIKSGAVVITEVETGAVRAVVSTPAFNPENVGESLNDESSPFINRAFRGYSLGSVFKIVTAAAAIENNIFLEEPFICTGSTLAGETDFDCYQGAAHGEVTMQTALEKSCNSYFIQLALALGKEKLLAQAQKMGLGQATRLADGVSSSAGILPSAAELDSDAGIGKFSVRSGQAACHAASGGGDDFLRCKRRILCAAAAN